MTVDVEKIRALCREDKDIRSLTRLEEMLGFSNGYIGKLAKTQKLPPYDRLVKIANALGVPVSYLTGEEQQKKPIAQDDGLTEDQIRAIEKIKNMPPDELARKMAALEAVLDM